MGNRVWLGTTLVVTMGVGCMKPPPPETATEASMDDQTESQGGSPFGPGGTLQGPIAKVDGIYAPNTGRPFDVVPGCHVVRTNTTHVDDRWNVTVTVQMAPLDFVLLVEPGHRYVIVREFRGASGPTVSVITYAREEDAEGNVVRKLGPVQDPALVERCKNAT